MEVFKSFINHLCNCLTGMRIQTFRDNEELHVGEEIVPALTEAIDESSVPIPVDGGASSSSTASGSTYEVFLSFRGADTRLNFTDHLYNYLTDVGVQTFRDNEELRVGEEIRPDLMKAIKESSISIPIFSENYASSKWCLRELTHMVKCMNEKDPEGRRRHTVCPVFYNVTPEVVKRQTGMFAKAFLKHTKDKVDECTIQEWKDALKVVAELKGWEKDKIADGHEAKLVEKIVKEVCRKLKKNNVSLTDNLVGMDHHMDEMTQLLDINGDNGVRIVGILGMGGIGKTTIAKSMYNQLCDHFQPQCSFLEDVREKVKRNGYAELRKQLVHDVLKREVDGNDIERSAFRNKKVLIVLDDVEDKSQLDKIIGTGDYFGSGSRIIVTTRNEEVFKELKGDLIYKPSEMNDHDSLLLFCNYAFQSPQPSEGYEHISKQLAQSAAGLPLSLVVIGSMLYKKKKAMWEEILKKLKVIPHTDVQQRLKISYDALDYVQQQIFLDIACHFIGKDQTDAMYMWDACGFFPKGGIDDLVSLSLINIEKIDNEAALFRMSIFRMHDQLRDLGRYIVNQENPSAVEDRSRLWSHQEAVDTLNYQSGTKKVQTLQIARDWDSSGRPYCFSNHDFKEMAKLRYLHLAGANLEGDFKGLLRELRWLTSTSMTFISFFPAKLVILDLSGSHISDGWESSIEIEAARNLKVLNLMFCRRLTKTPDFSKFRNLERLMLLGCYELTEIGSSVKHLKRLTYLNAKDCSRLRKLPPEFGSMTTLQQVFLGTSASSANWEGISELPDSIGLLTQLQCLSLKKCKSLIKIPESFWNLKSLTELDISDTGIRKLSPEGVGKLEKLQVLNCSECESLEGALPSGIGRLSSLRVLDLSWTKVDTLPEDVRNLGNLRKLNLKGSKVKKLPGVGIERLQNLEELDCSQNSSLEGKFPDAIWSLSSIRVLNLSFTMLDIMLPDDIGSLCNLKSLYLINTTVKRLPMVGIERLQKLEHLDCSLCSSLEGQLPDGIWSLPSLRHLNLSSTKISGILPKDISGMPNLENLLFELCENLRVPAEELKLPLSLTRLAIPLTEASLNAVRSLVNLILLLFYKNVGHCCEPVEEKEEVAGVVDHHHNNNSGTPVLLPIIDMPSNIKDLMLVGFDDHMRSCRLLPAMKFDSSSLLADLYIWRSCFETLPSSLDLSNCQMLKCLHIYFCQGMREIADFGFLWKEIDIRGCESLEVLPNLSTMKRLKTLKIWMCPKLCEIKGHEEVLTSLEELTIGFCDSLEVLPNFSTLNGLKTLRIGGCPELREIKGPEEVLTSLETLTIEDCDSLEVLLNFSTLKGLKTLRIYECPKLREIKGLEEVLTSLEELTIGFCPLLKEEELHPDVLNSESLRIRFEQNED